MFNTLFLGATLPDNGVITRVYWVFIREVADHAFFVHAALSPGLCQPVSLVRFIILSGKKPSDIFLISVIHRRDHQESFSLLFSFRNFCSRKTQTKKKNENCHVQKQKNSTSANDIQNVLKNCTRKYKSLHSTLME